MKEAIDAILEADQQEPRKQRHTAHRIWARLREEHPEHSIAEPTVRRYVQRRRQELGLGGRLVCVPQSYEFGQEAQATPEYRTQRGTADLALLSTSEFSRTLLEMGVPPAKLHEKT